MDLAERMQRILSEERDLAIAQAVDHLRYSNPWPESIWTMTEDEYVKAIPDETLRTRISGFLSRHGWNAAVNELERLNEVQP